MPVSSNPCTGDCRLIPRIEVTDGYGGKVILGLPEIENLLWNLLHHKLLHFHVELDKDGYMGQPVTHWETMYLGSNEVVPLVFDEDNHITLVVNTRDAAIGARPWQKNVKKGAKSK